MFNSLPEVIMNKNSIYLNYFFITVLLFPFFCPYSIKIMSKDYFEWDFLYNTVVLFRCIIAILYIVIFYSKRIKANLLTRMVILIELCIFLSCLINETITFVFTITNCITYIGFSCLLQVEAKKNSVSLLFGCKTFFSFFSFLAAFFILLFPNGFNDASIKAEAIYFLGSKNSSFFYFFMCVYFGVISNLYLRKKLSSFLLIETLLFSLCCIITNSANGFICIFLTFIYLLCEKYNLIFRKIFTPKFAILSITVFAIFIPFFASGSFDWLFHLIGRESHFSMRTYIWKSAIDLIEQQPLFGNGVNVLFFANIIQAHNVYLDLAAKFGLVVLFLFVMMLILISKKISKTSKSYLNNNSFFFFILFFHSLFDLTTMSFIIILLFYCCNEKQKTMSQISFESYRKSKLK